MNYAPSPENVLLGRGKLYFKLAGEDAELPFGNVTAFGISTEDEVRELYESMTAQAGLYKAVPVKRTITLNITGNEFSLDNVALAAMGVISELTQDAGTFASTLLTSSAKAGRFYALPHRAVSAVVVQSGSDTLVEGEDYRVDAEVGRIEVLPGSAAIDAELRASGSYAAKTLKTIEGGKAGNIEAFIRFVGDPAAGPRYEVQVWKAQLSPNGELGLISDDFGNWTLTGKVLAAGPAESPFYRKIKLN